MGLFKRRENIAISEYTLRYNEYYGMQDTFDTLYQRSLANTTKGINLFDLIVSKNNILLAYRNIKTNTGSKTKGTDGITISDYKIQNENKFIEDIKKALIDYKPQKVRRVRIPKANGKTRPLGIPTMRDRIIQQMFKQVLEPICEAKFYKHSYGFRPNRSTHHAMARCQFLINRSKLHYVVDVDIQGFFDNVNHTRLIKQLYNIGIKDKRVLTIISKMLKAPIEGEGIPTKGTPQGGILSPLLSNVVLNDLDHWINNQWNNMKRKNMNKFPASVLGRTNLKIMHIVRYADDFKIFTNNPKSAIKIFHAVKGYLNDHLKLEISKEKSTITNLRKRCSEFLGFKIKAVKKRKGFVGNTRMSDKKREETIKTLRKKIVAIRKNPSPKLILEYNATVLGVKNYFRIATHTNLDFKIIAYRLSKTLFNRLRSIASYQKPVNPNESYKKLHKNNYKTFKIGDYCLFPIADIQTRFPKNFTQSANNYSVQGRKELIKVLSRDIQYEITRMLSSQTGNTTVEYNNNRISKYSMQKGKCAITKHFLHANEVHCHHKTPKHLGGKDSFDNLIIVHNFVHKLIHATDKDTINRYMSILSLDGKQLRNLNTLRKQCKLDVIV